MCVLARACSCVYAVNQWRTQKVSGGEAKFGHNRVTSQFNFMGRAEGMTILGVFTGKSKSRANPEYSRKSSFAFAKTARFCFTLFHF